jgi:hypothetical protein
MTELSLAWTAGGRPRSLIQLTVLSSSVFEQADTEGDDEHRQRQR